MSEAGGQTGDLSSCGFVVVVVRGESVIVIVIYAIIVPAKGSSFVKLLLLSPSSPKTAGWVLSACVDTVQMRG